MRIRLNPEDGFKSPDADVEFGSEDGARVTASQPAPLRTASAAAKASILKTIEAAMLGTLDRPAGEGEFLEKFNETHVQIVLERALSNQTLDELGLRYDMHPQYVGMICRHPYARRLIAQITGAMADSVDDIQSRIVATAAEALETKIALMRTSQLDTVRDKIASDLLDRAGYGSRQRIDVNKNVTETRTLRVEGAESSRLADVLNEAMCVATVDYSQHVSSKPQVRRDEDGEAALPPSRLLSGDGLPQAASEGGVSHVKDGSSVPFRQERVA